MHDHSYHTLKFINYIFVISYFVFYLSCNLLFSKKQFVKFTKFKFVHKNTHLTFLLILALVIINAVIINNVSSSLFRGYSDGNHANVGPLVTFLIFITYLLIYILNTKNYFFFSILLSIILFLDILFIFSMGSRLYVLSSLIALILNYKFKNKIKDYSILFLIVLIIICVFLYVGNWRSGITYDDFWLVIRNGILYESLLSSYSFHSFFSDDNYYLFNLDYSLFSFILSIIPSLFLPNKGELLYTLINSYPSIYSPFGSINIFTSLVGTFGYVGTYIFLFLKSFVFSYLYNNQKLSVHIKVLYIMLCSTIPFIFFREHLFITFKLFFLLFTFSIFLKFMYFRKVRV